MGEHYWRFILLRRENCARSLRSCVWLDVQEDNPNPGIGEERWVTTIYLPPAVCLYVSAEASKSPLFKRPNYFTLS